MTSRTPLTIGALVAILIGVQAVLASGLHPRLRWRTNDADGDGAPRGNASALDSMNSRMRSAIEVRKSSFLYSQRTA